MSVLKVFFDDYGNRATIDRSQRPAYRGGRPCPHYRLTLLKENYIYFVSVYESMKEAREKLKEFSCGTFREEAKIAK